MTETGPVLTRIGLPTGVTLTVQLAGPEDAPVILFLHGFPESHRTWRALVPALAERYRCVAPDQRGFAKSDKPDDVDEYRVDQVLGDLLALADALKIGRFTLVGHDWGGAVAWAAALKHADRIDRLVILNAPHPYIFQRSLIENEAQRAASQYIRFFRNPAAETMILAMGLDSFFEKTFADQTAGGWLPEDERQAYLEEWSQPGALTGMLNWYRAAQIEVPAPDEKARLPLWTHLPFPHVKVPTLVVWGLRDKALLPVQLEGLDRLVDDLTVVPVADAGHFLPWEKPEPVLAAIKAFLDNNRPAIGSA